MAAASAALRVDDMAEARRRLSLAPEPLREWEWRHLLARTDVSSETIRFPGSELWGGTVSADGSVVAISGGLFGSANRNNVFAMATKRDGSVLAEWRVVGGNPPAVALSPDGRLFAAGFYDGTIRVRDLTNGREPPVVAAHTANVIELAFSADGALLASGGADGTARLFDVGTWTPRRSFEGHGDRVISLAFDPQGRRLVTGVRDGTIHVWDVASGETLRVLRGHSESVEGVAVSPDGERVASVSRDRTVRLWNLTDGAALAVRAAHASNVRDVAFDPVLGGFVSASWDGTLRLWDGRTGEETGILRGHGGAVTAVAFSSQEPRLSSFSWDGSVKRWDVKRTEVPTCREFGDLVESVAFDPSGTRVAAGCGDGTVVVMDAATATPMWRARADHAVAEIRFVDAPSVSNWNARGLGQVFELPGAAADRGSPVSSALATMRGRYVVSLDSAWRVAWVVSSGKPEDVVGSVARIDLGAPPGGETPLPGTCAAPFVPNAVAFHGASGTLAAASLRGDLRIWHDPGLRTATDSHPHAERITRIAFDEAGGRICTASTDGTARIIRVSDLAILAVLEGHSGPVLDAAFLPGGRRVVTVSRDGTVRIWDTSDGECVLVLHGHGYPVHCVAVSPDGTQSTVKIWTAPLPGAR